MIKRLLKGLGGERPGVRVRVEAEEGQSRTLKSGWMRSLLGNNRHQKGNMAAILRRYPAGGGAPDRYTTV